MRVFALTGFVATLAAAGAAHAIQPTPNVPSTATQTLMLQIVKGPTSSDFERYFPYRAARDDVSGKVKMACIATEKGALSNCRILTEAPPGYGFGQAAKDMAGLFRVKPTTADGVSVVGTEVVIPIDFNA
jgi:TonB family protein